MQTAILDRPAWARGAKPLSTKGIRTPVDTPPHKVRAADPHEVAWLADQSRRLEGATPEAVLAWAVDRYFPRFTMATGLGPEGCLIISMLAKIEPRMYVFNLDTGYQFPETLELRERIEHKYGVLVDLQRPDLSVAAYEAASGGPVYATAADRCCFDRKISVLHRVAKNYDAWATGVRRDQSPTRANTPVVGWDAKFGMVKVNPLACWTKKDVWKRILADGVPYNPLHDKGYPSIGCWPCTRAVQPGEDERAGRWSGSAKTECGLHAG
jgi:phosphoadenosine phosphosulfate reductase